MSVRHFLTLRDLSVAELHDVIDLSIKMKAAHYAGRDEQVMAGKVLAMIFEKASTRTRVSFEAGMAQLGGHAIFFPQTIRSWVAASRWKTRRE
jgi:ornithine carbamoyltransferase